MSLVVCVAAARALGDLKDKRAVPSLIEALTYPDQLTRMAAVEALGKIGDVQAVPHLITVIQQFSGGRVAFEALKCITGQDFGEDVACWRQWWNSCNQSHGYQY
jgi:hypothetical protein